jgi:hypothetical protein
MRCRPQDELRECMPSHPTLFLPRTYAARVPYSVCVAAQVVDSIVGKKRLAKLDLVVAGDDVKAKKPDPMIYNLAAKRLGLAPERCLVIEDSMVGLRAANGCVPRTPRRGPFFAPCLPSRREGSQTYVTLISLLSALSARMPCLVTYTRASSEEDFYGEGAAATVADLVTNGGVSLSDLFDFSAGTPAVRADIASAMRDPKP